MKTLNVFLIVSVSLIVVTFALNAINILQAGSREADGRTMAQILGKDPRAATYPVF